MAKTDSRRRKGSAAGRLPDQVRTAITAAQDKKALQVVVLDLRPSGAFTDYFILCTGHNKRQVQAIADGIKQNLLGQLDVHPSHVEGYDRAEWVLLDYFDFVVHIFAPDTRNFYDLERLWGSAERSEIPDPGA